MDVNSALIRFGERWLKFKRPIAVLSTARREAVCGLIKAAEAEAMAGRWAVGWISYEAAPCFDSALSVKAGRSIIGIPLVWFGIYRRPVEISCWPRMAGSFEAGPWRPSMLREEYRRAIRAVKRYLAAGDTYQVNYTIRLRADFRGEPWPFFLRLVAGQMSDQCAFILTDSHAVCSASPELFIELRGNRLISRPMKGTAPRGLTWREDVERAKCLLRSDKNRAENVMIVDMIRNDMGRIAVPGTVKVSRLFEVERYPTVLQMTSTVECRTEAGIAEVLNAMFPCASVTGAPKVRTMEIISELETSPRGIYTGSIGFMGPENVARFNVAIRTAVIDLIRHRAEYGVGGGIVWDSDADEEYRECLIKARVLEGALLAAKPVMRCFDLLETVLWTPRRGYYLLPAHLRRMRESALYFQRPFFEAAARAVLARAAKKWRRHARRVRLLMDAEGKFRVESYVMHPHAGQLRLAIAKEPVNSRNVFLYHKTTNREIYETARSCRPGFDDVVLYNEKGEVTETTIGNIVVEKDGVLLTPPVGCGLLPGVYRDHLLRKRIVREGVLTLDDLRRAKKIWMINSVRRWVPAKLAG